MNIVTREMNGTLTEGTARKEGDDRAKDVRVGGVKVHMEVCVGIADDRGDDSRVVYW